MRTIEGLSHLGKTAPLDPVKKGVPYPLRKVLSDPFQ
jgi:hypothetical protein